MYEDIAKLNPFYEEYENFWNDSPGLEATFSSSASSKRTSSGSLYSGSDSFSSFNRSSSPPLAPIPRFDSLCMPEGPEFHSVSQHRPAYKTHEGLDHSQIAYFDDDGDYDPRYSYIGSPAKMPSSDPVGNGTHDGSSQYKGLPRKQLFGDKGWLGNVPDILEVPDKRKSTMFKELGKKIKQHVGDIVSLCRCMRSRSKGINRSFQAVDMVRSHPLTHGPNNPKIVGKPMAPVSLSPVAQAKLYTEMELMVCISANNFLVEQYSEGRLSAESIKKVTDSWVSKNRPQVVQFQFDQDTQRQLILSNIRTLDFHGESSTNPVLLNSTLNNWKSIVKEMSVRTFCLPDSAIRKHLHDIHKILDMLGAPLPTFLAFQELEMRTLSQMKDELVKSQRYSGNGVSSMVRGIGQVATAR